MIRIFLGNPGSGKTACFVRELVKNLNKRPTYSNIQTKNIKNNIAINHEMIIKKEVIDTRKKRNGEVENVYEYKLNKEFWQTVEKPINVCLDEAHSVVNSRRSMSKVNIIVTDWLALIRRILGSSESGYGMITFITQLPFRIDSVAREMSTHIRYHICHYNKECQDCKGLWKETSQVSEPIYKCPICNSLKIKKFNHKVEVFCFNNMENYLAWNVQKRNTYYRHFFITDIEEYFDNYDTLQWENMFSEVY